DDVESIVPESSFPFNKSVFRRPLQKALSVHEGNDFALECEMNDGNQPTDWFLDDDKIMPDNEHFKVVDHGPVRKLKVHKAEPNDSGRYTCADRKTGEKTNTDVDVIEVPIKIVKPLPEKITVNQGENLKLEVELSHPNVQGCHFARYDNKNEQQLLRKDKRTKVSCEGVKFTLVLDSLFPVDAGVYEFLGPNNLQSNCQVIVKAHPSITQPLKDVTLPENQNLTLEARVDNEHAPISWFFNGQELKSEQHTTILSKGRRHTLVVQKVKMENAGQYEIRTPDDKSACQVMVEQLDGVEFIKQLTIRPKDDIKETQPVELVCETNKDNVPVEWSKDGELCNDQRLKIQTKGRVHSITIEESLSYDQGVYTCKIKSNNKTTTATLKIQESPADFTHKIEPIDAIKGDTVTFECQLNKSKMSVKWLKDNKPLTLVPGRFEAVTDTDNDRNHLLTIRNVDTKDEGTYTCVIDNTTPSKKCSASLNVKGVTLKLVEPLKDVTINESGDLVLKFTVSHDIKQLATWKSDGQPVKTDERVQIEQDGKMHFLTIKNIKLTEKGKYTAQLMNIETSCKVTVKSIPYKVVKELYIVDNKQPNENESVTLEIELNKPLDTDVILLKDGINTLKSKTKTPVRVQAKHTGNGIYQFTIDNLQVNDSGLYEVPVTPNLKSSLTLQIRPKQEEIKNAATEIEKSKPVEEVQSIPISDIDKQKTPLEEDQVTKDKSLPKTQDYDFTIPLKGTITLNDNEPLHLECTLNFPVEKLTDTTPEAIVWLRNGTPLASDRVKTNANGVKLTLDIDNVKLNEDDGKYTLRLPNGKQCSVQVDIKAVKMKKLDVKNEISVPLHILLEKDKNQPWNENVVSNGPTAVGENILLRCKTSKPVKLVEWYKGARKVTSRRAVPKSTENSTVHELLLSKIEAEDLGQYRVLLDNDLEDKVDVIIPQKLGSITIDGDAVENGTVTLTCDASLPPKKIRWLKSQKSIDSDKRFEPRETDKRLTLKIKNLKLDDSQLYTLEVDNITAEYQLTVKEQPLKFVGELEITPKLPKEDDTVTCTVQLNKSTSEPLLWYLNGKPISIDVDADARFSLKSDGPKHILTIKKIRPEDAGRIECRLSSNENEKLSAELKVKEKTLQILKPLTSNIDKPLEGEDVELSCQFSKKPKQIEIYKDGKKLLPRDLENKLNDNDFTFTIYLPKTKPTDKGKYTVNADGIDTSYTLRLTSDPIRFVEALKFDKEPAYEGDTVKATFTVNKVPSKPPQWLKGTR
ncbi:unnamed protein product, partial [Didymodactylos carnosus]